MHLFTTDTKSGYQLTSYIISPVCGLHYFCFWFELPMR